MHLTEKKQHYTTPRNYSLDVIEQGNLDQINDLLNDITNGIELGGFNELEARYIYEDTEVLWAEVSQTFVR
ncbi:hypothetical protein ACFKJ8_00075 [Streptococcus agalactiae]|uniref:hypothetical protein n=1 Tax=Streptococcus agalactiae TaxID=1311 RepID=UPI00363B4A35